MAIGVPGTVDSSRGIVLDAPALGWSNKDIKSIFRENFSFPVFIDNDVKLAILSEKNRGSLKGSSNMFYISIGTGVGSSFIVNNQLVRGSSFEAGEIGYFLNENDVKAGDLSKTGEFGMLERRISGTALNEEAKDIGLDSFSLFEEYYNGNLEAKKIIDDFILNLSIVLANVISLLNPEIVVIGGGVSTSMNGLLNNIQETVAKLTPIKSKIIISQFGNDSGAIGAIEYIKNSL
jgi:glucokinase